MTDKSSETTKLEEQITIQALEISELKKQLRNSQLNLEALNSSKIALENKLQSREELLQNYLREIEEMKSYTEDLESQTKMQGIHNARLSTTIKDLAEHSDKNTTELVADSQLIELQRIEMARAKKIIQKLVNIR